MKTTHWYPHEVLDVYVCRRALVTSINIGGSRLSLQSTCVIRPIRFHLVPALGILLLG